MSDGGLRMDGMFRMGRPHGFVKVYDTRGNVIYEGRFINGRPKSRSNTAAASAAGPNALVDLERFRFERGAATAQSVGRGSLRRDASRRRKTF